MEDEVVIRPEGELDLASARTLEDAVRKIIDGDASVVTLDLSGLSFIDSSLMAALRLPANCFVRHVTDSATRGGIGSTNRLRDRPHA